MIFRSLMVFLLCALLPSLQAAPKPVKPPDWLSRVTGEGTGPFPAPRPCEAVWRGGWSGVNAGSVEATMSGTKRQLRMQLSGKTSGLARSLFQLDTAFDSRLDRRTLFPVASTIVVEDYSDEKRTTVQTFTPETVTRTRGSVPPQPGDGKTRTWRLPRVYDLHGALLHVRSQRLQKGDRMVFVAYATDSPYLVTVSVDGPERLTVPAGRYAAIRLQMKLESIDRKTLRLKSYAKAREMQVWISDDRDRLFLKARAEMTIGAILVELGKVTFQ